MQPMIIIVVVKKIINFFAQNVILTKIDFYILEFGQMNASAILNSMIQSRYRTMQGLSLFLVLSNFYLFHYLFSS